jgi:hypothetical protein
MLHPHTELRFVSPEIGHGVFATQDIPKGTITWVRDELDRVFVPSEIQKLSPPNLENLLKYTYRDKNGDYFFCWDLTRYINHSYRPNSMLTAQGFEIAIRDIKEGDEITNDYGTLNIIEPFICANGPHQRESVKPDDLTRFFKDWDELINSALKLQSFVPQPLRNFLTLEQNENLRKIQLGLMQNPSVLENYFSDK